MGVILDGKKLADNIIEELRKASLNLTKKPKLAVIIVGDNPASQIYVRNKQKTAQYIGFDSLVISLENNVSEDSILEHIYILNEDKDINAILLQLPINEKFNKKRIIEAIEPIKDVDGFTSYNFGRLALGYEPFSYPCTPKGIIRLLDEYNISLAGKKAIVIGRSNIVGKPMALMLQQKNATVICANSYTKNLKELSYMADIVISAVGKPNFIDSSFIKENAVVIDVGINRVNDKLTGDVDFESVKDKASFITPVPKGVGPMTIAMLMENTLNLYNIQSGLIL